MVASALPGGIPVTITVTASANPSSFGQDVTYTATLVTSDSRSLVNPDSIEFQDNGNDVKWVRSSAALVNTRDRNLHGNLR